MSKESARDNIPLASEPDRVKATTAVGSGRVVRRADLSRQRVFNSTTEPRARAPLTHSISRFSSSSDAPGKATLNMVVRETASVS